MRILRTMGTGVRHAAVAATEAALVVAIGVALVFSTAVVTGGKPAGADPAHAASLSATISVAGNAPQPYPVSNPIAFNVTRSSADNTVYWVYNYCWNSSNKLLSTEAYPVLWPSYDSLTGGTYPYVFKLSGTHCEALVTIRPWTAKPLGNAVLYYKVL